MISMLDQALSMILSATLMACGLAAFYVSVSPRFATKIVRTLALGTFGVSGMVLAVWEFNGIQPDELDNIVRVQGIMAISAIVIAVYFFAGNSVRDQLRTLHVITDAMPLDDEQQAQVSGGRRD